MPSPDTPSIPNVDTHIPELASLPLARNVITTMPLDTSLPCAKSPGQAETLGINAPGCPGTVEPNSRGPVAANTQTNQPAEAGSPTEAPGTACLLTAPASTGLHTIPEEEDA